MTKIQHAHMYARTHVYTHTHSGASMVVTYSHDFQTRGSRVRGLGYSPHPEIEQVQK